MKTIENETLQKRIAENEATIALLQRRESELGAQYNALLADHEALRHLLEERERSESKSEMQQSDRDESEDQDRQREIDTLNPMPQGDTTMQRLHDPILCKLRSASSGTGLVREERAIDLVEGGGTDRERRVRQYLQLVATETDHLDRKLRLGGNNLVGLLSEARGEQHRLRDHLHRLDRSLTGDAVTLQNEDAPSMPFKTVHLHLDISNAELSTDRLLESNNRLKKTLERVKSANVQSFEAIRRLMCIMPGGRHDCIQNLNLESGTSCPVRSMTPEMASQDDLYLHRLRGGHRWGDRLSEINDNARSMRDMRKRIDRLNEASEIETFIVAEQQLLLQQQRLEIVQRQAEQEAVAREMASLSSASENRRVELDQAKQEADARQQQWITLKQELEDCQVEIVRLKQSAAQAEHDRLDAWNCLSTVLQEREGIEYELQSLERQLEETESKISSEKATVEQIHEKRLRLEHRLSQQSTDLEELNRQLRALLQECQEKEALLETKSSEARSKMEEIRQLARRQKELDGMLHSLDQKNGMLVNIHQQKEQRIQSQHSAIASIQSSRDLNREWLRPDDRMNAMHRDSASEDSSMSPIGDHRPSPTPLLDLKSRHCTSPPSSSPTALDTFHGRRSERLASGMHEVREESFVVTESSDLLIRRLEEELRKQQEQNDRQKNVIEQLASDLEGAVTDDRRQETEAEPMRLPSTDVRNLQIGLRHALDDMSKLHERMQSLKPGVAQGSRPRRRASYSSGQDRSPLPSASDCCRTAASEVNPSRKTTALVFKTRGQMRSELAAAEQQMLNLESKMKDVVRLSSMKDRLISDLEKRVAELHLKNFKRSRFWRY